MQVKVFDTTAKDAGTIELDETIFGIEPNMAVMHQAFLRQRANARLGTSNTLTRGEVSGGGRKPWRQKGTGRARQGSTRSPQWKGGGVVFGPHPRSYRQDMPKKMRRLAIRSVLSAKVRDDQTLVIQGIDQLEPKTKAMIAMLTALPGSQRSTLIVIGPGEEQGVVHRAAGNLENVKVIRAGYVNVRDVLTHERLLLTTEAVETIQGLWSMSEEAPVGAAASS
ncbi:MAG TPA: 50S ribosomal protein L4 [Thermomicrobiales bacterium]|nr:50S ribosomal protein L4 [Thermomicrobiales bacterium]